MKVLSFETIRKMDISPKECLSWVEESISNKDQYILPPKTSLKPFDGVFYNTMPAITDKYAGVKEVTRYPEREPSLDSQILLYDKKTGSNLAILDGNWITAMRTGAVAAHSIELFAKKGYKTVAFMGLGNVARATLLMLLESVPEKKLKVKLLRYKDQHDSFIERFKAYSNISFEVVDSYEALIRGSDVIVSAVTYLGEDITKDEWYEEGVLLVPVHTRGFTNCDLFFDKVFADDRGHVCGFKNFEKFKQFAEVSDVMKGVAEGRKTEKERIIAYNIGVAIHDIVFAGKIYEESTALEDEIMCDAPKEKFWI